MIRGLLGLLGAAAVGWGGWLLRDDGLDRWRSQAAWFVGGVLGHDALIAPFIVLLGVAGARGCRPRLRPARAGGGVGRPDNPSLMNRPYVVAWIVFTIVVITATAITVARGRTTERH